MKNTVEKKRPLFVVVLALVALIAIGLCLCVKTHVSGSEVMQASSSVSSEEAWPYLDFYEQALAMMPADSNGTVEHNIDGQNFGEASADKVEIFNEVKAAVKSKYAEYACMNWEGYDDIGIEECDSDEEIVGYYDSDKKTVFINRPFYSEVKDSTRMREILAHELIHALVGNDVNRGWIWNEGWHNQNYNW